MDWSHLCPTLTSWWYHLFLTWDNLSLLQMDFNHQQTSLGFTSCRAKGPKENRSSTSLMRPRLRTGTISFHLHSTDQVSHKVKPIFRAGQTDSTFWWEDLFSHIAKDSTEMVPFMKSTALLHQCLELQVRWLDFFPNGKRKLYYGSLEDTENILNHKFQNHI